MKKRSKSLFLQGLLMTGLLVNANLIVAQDKDVAAKPAETQTSLFDQFNGLSQKALTLDSAINNSGIFIEQEINDQLAPFNSLTSLQDSSQGQWSVSFDLNQMSNSSSAFDLNQSAINTNQSIYDWGLGSSLVSSDQTSRFYVNYGNRKVPISISFDENSFNIPTTSTDALSQKQLQMGFDQQLNESWAVSISYLKTDNDLDNLSLDFLNAQQSEQFNYLFDFSNSNQLETLNFSPLNQNQLNGGSFFNDVSAIQIKVSRKLSDSIGLTASASTKESSLAPYSPSHSNAFNQLDGLAISDGINQMQSQQVSLEGQYNITDSWSLDANLEREKGQLLANNLTLDANKSDIFDSTTLDIGVQYQSNWDQVGVVIRIDLLNLLGVSQFGNSQNRMNLDNNGLIPFSFETPKYIKLSGSINF